MRHTRSFILIGLCDLTRAKDLTQLFAVESIMDECAFCGIASRGDEELIVLRTPTVFVIPSLRQRRLNRGHMLVLPVKHATRIVDLDRTLIANLYLVAARVSAAVQQAFGASGMLLFQNETIPGQVLHHIHVHVVPRREGDNFKLPDPLSEEVSQSERKEQAAAMRRVLDLEAFA